MERRPFRASITNSLLINLEKRPKIRPRDPPDLWQSLSSKTKRLILRETTKVSAQRSSRSLAISFFEDEEVCKQIERRPFRASITNSLLINESSEKRPKIRPRDPSDLWQSLSSKTKRLIFRETTKDSAQRSFRSLAISFFEDEEINPQRNDQSFGPEILEIFGNLFLRRRRD